MVNNELEVLRNVNAELLEALKLARTVLIIACGNTAPYIKQAFAQIDPVIARAEASHA